MFVSETVCEQVVRDWVFPEDQGSEYIDETQYSIWLQRNRDSNNEDRGEVPICAQMLWLVNLFKIKKLMKTKDH